MSSPCCRVISTDVRHDLFAYARNYPRHLADRDLRESVSRGSETDARASTEWLQQSGDEIVGTRAQHGRCSHHYLSFILHHVHAAIYQSSPVTLL